MTVGTRYSTKTMLLSRIKELEASLQEVSNTLDAIRHGDIDAVMISNTLDEYHLHTLQSVDHPYRTLIEHIPEGAITLTEGGTVLYANATLARMIGVSEEELLGRKLQRFLSPSDTITFRRMLNEAKLAGTRGELTVYPAIGASFPIYISLNFLRKNGDESLLCGVLTDITEQKNHLQAITEANAALVRSTNDLAHARDAAEQANGTKTRFLAGMTHELRTPLHGILGYAQLLRLGIGLDAKQLAQIDAMLAAGAHLLFLINNVLTISEIETARVELRPSEFSLEVIAVECLDLVRPMAEAKGLALSVSIVPGLPLQMFADQTRLRQILLNFLGNAVKFTARGSIELHVERNPGSEMVRIEVVDTGPGISAPDRRRLFVQFERVGNANVTSVEGAGLGLSLSAGLATIMGGEIGHEDNPGGGSVFWLKLPLRTAAAVLPLTGIAAESLDVHPAFEPEPRIRVLVVDDIAMNREIVGAFLRAAGHEITYATGGTEAVVIVASSDFDVVLMDIRMPDVDGLEATRRIRELGGNRGHVPIVALTAQTFAEQIEACRRVGMDGYLAKPFTLASLLGAIERGIASAQARGSGGKVLVNAR